MDDLRTWDRPNWRQPPMDDTPIPEFAQRSILQILVKTFFTHAISVANYSQLSDLLNVSTKYNVRLIRCILFTVLPTIILGQLAYDLAKGAIHVLRNPHELDIEAPNAKKAYLMIFEGILGLRAVPSEVADDDSPPTESTELLDVPSADVTTTRRAPWTSIRLMRLALTSLALLLSIAAIVLFARRADKDVQVSRNRWSHCVTGIDFRDMYIAAGGIVACVLNLYFLLTGMRWTYDPPVSAEAAPRPGWLDLQRVAVEFIIGGIIQEFIAVKSYMDNSGSPSYVTCFVDLLDRIRMRPLEVILIIAVIAMAIIFRHDIATRLGVNLRLIYTLLTVIFVAWIGLDTFLLFVTDIGHFLIGNYGYEHRKGERWADPWEKWIPII